MKLIFIYLQWYICAQSPFEAEHKTWLRVEKETEEDPMQVYNMKPKSSFLPLKKKLLLWYGAC